MAGSVNKVILIGHLGKDPEIRSQQSGSRVANFSLATSEKWKAKGSGEMQERTEWHKVSVFNDRITDFLERYIKKGRKVYVEGQLQTRKWTDREGIERYTTEVVVGAFRGDVVALDAGPRDGEDGDRAGGSSSSYGGRSGSGGQAAPGGARGGSGNVQGSIGGSAGGWEPSNGDLDDEIPF